MVLAMPLNFKMDSKAYVRTRELVQNGIMINKSNIDWRFDLISK